MNTACWLAKNKLQQNMSHFIVWDCFTESLTLTVIWNSQNKTNNEDRLGLINVAGNIKTLKHIIGMKSKAIYSLFKIWNLKKLKTSLKSKAIYGLFEIWNLTN